MKRITALLLFLLVVSLSSVFAATLDELHKPLLDKDQWRADAHTHFAFYDIRARDDPLTSAADYEAYDYFYYQLIPSLYYGITDKLQLKLTTDFTTPYNYDSKQYLEGNGPLTSSKSNTEYDNSFTEAITWRPQESWEVSFSSSQGFSKTRDYDYDYTSIEFERTDSKSDAYSFMTGASWLSAPRAGNKTAANRPDLDGLLTSLLDEGQIKISLPVGYHLYDGKVTVDADQPAPDVEWQTYNTKMHTFYLRPAFYYGIKDNLQADLNFYWYPATVNRNKMVGYTYSFDGVDVFEAFSTTKSRQLNHFTPQLTFTHRPDSQLQWYVQGYYDYDTARSNYNYQSYTNGVLGFDSSSENKLKDSILSGIVGFTWITLPEKAGEKLSANLDGLKNPLLEKHQVKLDFSYTATRYRTDSATGASTRDEYHRLYTKATYGLLDILQTYFYTTFTINHDYMLTSSPTSIYKYIYPLRGDFGIGMTYRPRQDFELYLDALISPWNDLKTEHSDGTGLDNIRYSEQAYTTFSIGATILW